MTRRFNFLSALALIMLFSVVAFAQPNVSEDFSQESELSLTKEPKSKYPPKPKDMWEVSVHGGYYAIGGDVLPSFFFPGFGVGVGVRKSLNYTWSLRGDLTYNRTKGLNHFLRTPSSAEVAAGFTGTQIARNYLNSKTTLSFSAIANLTNINFHKSESKLGIYAFAGVGLRFGDVSFNLRDGNTEHNFVATLGSINTSDADGRRSAREALRNLIEDNDSDGYESPYVSPTRIEFLGQPISQVFTGHLGAGIAYRLSDVLSLSLEPQLIYMRGDEEDGFVSGGGDVGLYVPLRLGFFLGDKNKKSVPLWWVNPLDEPYAAIAANTKKKGAEEILKDKDNDGVPDMIDKEQDTPAGAEVDTRGVTLDSDKDGLANHLDKEPYSPVGYKIDPSTGISEKPKMPKVMTKDEVIAIGKAQKWDEKPVADTKSIKDWFLPMIHFDLDKTNIKSQYYSSLAHVATVLKNYPSINVVVEGHADARSSVNYNLGLSYKRAENAINALVSNYGISRDRLILRYTGESAPLVPNSPNNYMNRRVEFKVATGGETNMSAPSK